MTSSPPPTHVSPHPLPHVERAGHGFPVLLLHGWGASSQLFRAVMSALSAEHDVIALDFPGFGATPPPPEPWSVGDYAAWLRDVMDSLGVRQADVIGHSFGGKVAIKLAAAWPDRVRRLVLTDSAGIVPRRTWRYHVRVRLFKGMRWLAQSALTPGPCRRWASGWVARQGSSDYRQASGVVRATLVRVVNEDLQGLLPAIQAPTLLIWGERDEDTPVADAQLMERLIPDAGLVIFEGAGHFAYLEQVGRFCHIVLTFFKGGK